MKKIIPALAVTLLLLGSCQSKDKVYEQHKNINGSVWKYSEPANFTVELKDTSSKYNIFISIVHSGKYPYANLWTAINIVSPNGQTQTDTINMFLLDKNNQWLGKTKGKNTYIRFLYKDSVKIAEPGKYFFSIKHIMRKDNLDGIEKIGLIITKVE